MKTNVYCLDTEKGTHNLFLEACGETHYLFSCPKDEDVRRFFCGGVHIDSALDCTRAKHSPMLRRVIDKLPAHIKYIEQEYGITVLRKTARKNSRDKRRAA